MVATHFNSLERVFSRRELFRGKSLQALLWGVCASFALCLLLIDLFLIAELLETRGRLVEESDAQRYSELFPHDAGTDSNAGAAKAGPGAPSSAVARFQQEEAGLRPAVLRQHDVPLLGAVLSQAYHRFAWFRENLKCLTLLVLIGVVIACVRGLCLWRAKTVSTGVALDAATRLRRTLHRQTLRLGPGDLTDPEGTQVIGLFTNEVDQVRDSIQTWIYRLGCNPSQLAFLLLLALAVQWRIALQCLILLGGCWFLVQRQRLRSAAAEKLEEARADSRLRLLAEGLRKTRIVRGYGMEDFEHEHFQHHLEKFRTNVLQVLNMQHYLRLAVGFLVLACVAAVVYLVGSKVLQPPDVSHIWFSTALLMMAIVAAMPRPLAELWELPVQRFRASQAADRIYRYLNQIPAVSQAVGAKFLEPVSRTIGFEAVSYTLPNKRKLLDGIDLTLSAGEVIALVAFEPLEARAMACLLPRFIEPQSGRILFDGEDIAWGTLESLRAETVYVGGSDPFFTGTVVENIICSHSGYTLSDVTEAAKTTHAHHFIQKLPQGYETVIGEHGERLDPGQGFRLGLARAVLRNPSLLIIEEPTESLDEDTKSLLDDSYNRIVRGRTVVFLPNRLSTLRRSETVVFLHRGKVEAHGPYHDLVKNSSLFRHWEYMHFNQFRRELDSPLS
ncbi:MAG TPA: ABC transporter ATP-binding protein, partial [Planctomycetaceae bacterium]|nr:ABC transporter ATP-binding protein [Planctomycetaceae bacterium]